jgi:hypothetical protein
MKFIQQGLQFSWFIERATTSSKILLGIKLKLQSNYVNASALCDILLIYIVSLNNIKH